MVLNSYGSCYFCFLFSGDLDDVLVNNMVTIHCRVQRSTFHAGRVKFVLLIGDTKIDDSTVAFEKDAQSTVETDFRFVAENDMHGGSPLSIMQRFRSTGRR